MLLFSSLQTTLYCGDDYSAFHNRWQLVRRLKIDLKSVCQQEASVRDNILFIKKENFSQKEQFFPSPTDAWCRKKLWRF